MKSVWIIESLKPTDPKLGQGLKDFLGSRVSSSLFFPKSEAELSDILAKVSNAAKDAANCPIAIQFFCHGNSDGVRIQGDGFIEWEQLRAEFRDIYVKSGKRVFVNMGSCKGFNVGLLLVKHEPCPFSELCGTSKVLRASDARDGFNMFYDWILKGSSPEQAAAEVDIAFPSFECCAYSTDRLWDIVANNYRASLTDENVSRMLAEALDRHKAAIAASPESKEKLTKRLTEAYTRESLEKRLSDWEKTFKS